MNIYTMWGQYLQGIQGSGRKRPSEPSPDDWYRPPRKKLPPIPGNVMPALIAHALGKPRRAR